MKINYDILLNLISSKYQLFYINEKKYFRNEHKEIVASCDDNNIYMYFTVPTNNPDLMTNQGIAVTTFSRNNDNDTIIIEGLNYPHTDVKIKQSYKDYSLINGKEIDSFFSLYMINSFGSCGSITTTNGNANLNICDTIFINQLAISKRGNSPQTNIINNKKENLELNKDKSIIIPDSQISIKENNEETRIKKLTYLSPSEILEVLSNKEEFEKIAKQMNYYDWIYLLESLDLDFEIDRKIKEKIFFDKDIFAFISKELNYNFILKIINDLNEDYEIDRKIKELLLSDTIFIECIAKKMNGKDLYPYTYLYETTNGIQLELIEKLFSSKIIAILSQSISDEEWETIIRNLTYVSEASRKIKKSLLTNKETLTILSKALSNRNKVKISTTFYFSSIYELETKESLFLDEENFNIWSSSLNGDEITTIIIGFKVAYESEINILENLFRNKSLFNLFSFKLNGLNWYNIILCFIEYKDYEKVLDIIFRDQESLEILCEQLDEEQWDDLIKRFKNISEKIKYIQFLIENEKVFPVLVKKINPYTWKGLVYTLSGNNTSERKELLELLFSKEKISTLLKNIANEPLIDIINYLEDYNPIDCKIKLSLFKDKEIFAIISNALNGEYKYALIEVISLNTQPNNEIREIILTDDEYFKLFTTNMEETFIEKIIQFIMIDETYVNIKKSIFTNEKIFNIWAPKLSKNIWVELIEKLLFKTDDNKDIIELLFFEKERFQLLLSIIDEEVWNIIIDKLSIKHIVHRDIIKLLNTTLFGNKYSFNTEEKNKLLEKEENLEEKLNSFSDKDLLKIIDYLDTPEKLDRELRKQILTQDKYLQIILDKVGAEKFISIVELLDVTNEDDAKIKEKIYLGNNKNGFIMRNITPNLFVGCMSYLNPEKSLDSKIKVELVNDENIFKKVILDLSDYQMYYLFYCFKPGSVVDDYIKLKIYTNEQFLLRMLDLFDTSYFKSFFDYFTIPNECDYKIKKNLLLNEKHLKIIAPKVNILYAFYSRNEKTSKEDLLLLNQLFTNENTKEIILENNSMLNGYEIILKNIKEIDLLPNFKKTLLLDKRCYEELDRIHSKSLAEDYIKSFISLNKSEDYEIAEEILLKTDENEKNFQLFGLPLIYKALDFVDENKDLFYKIASKLTNNVKYLENLVVNTATSNLLDQLEKIYDGFDKIENRFIFAKIIETEAVIDIISNSDLDVKREYGDLFTKVKSEAFKKYKDGVLINAIDGILNRFTNGKSYNKKELTGMIGSPVGNGTVYRFHRGTFVIDSFGNNITANFDRGETEIIIAGKQVEENYSWWHHDQGIRESLRIFGLPSEELSALEDHAFTYSIYGRDKGYLIILIEGEKMQIYFPDNLTAEQLAKLHEILASIEEYEKINEIRMEISLLISDKIIDELPLHPLYTENVEPILKEELSSYPSLTNNQ